MFKKMKPPFSYYGGKQRMVSKLIPLIPKHTVYAEPFGGSGGLLFAKPWPKVANIQNYVEIWNDKNELVYNFFKQLRENGENLCEQIFLTADSEKEYKISKDFNCGDLEKARRFFVNINQSFASKQNGGWGRSIFGHNRALRWANKINLTKYLDRIITISFSCTDALKFIDQFDSPQTFFYVDPPYPGTDQGHYAGYAQEEFDALVDKLKNIQGSFLLSCYGDPQCDQLFERFDFDAVCSAKGRAGYDRTQKKDESDQNRKRIEVVYRKFSIEPRDEIKKLYASGAFDCFVKHSWEQ